MLVINTEKILLNITPAVMAASDVTTTLPILVNITIALVAAFIGGLIARLLSLPPVVGYLLAGVAIGPFTPGFVGDYATIVQLAELGVIFLLFGVGLHFSLRDLWSVRRIAIPGALIQMALTTLLAVLITWWWGWSLSAGLVIGLAVSIASTVVLLRNLMDQGLLNTSHGKVVVGWLILEDLATVLILVLLPAFSGNGSATEPLWQTTGLALLKAVAFAVLMLVVGTRVLPWLLTYIAKLQSRELFIVTVIVITLGTALGAAFLFGVSLALGAFLAGVVVNESALSHQVEAEVLPFRETFAVLFFVSVGMLVNPAIFINQFGQVFAITALIIAGKALFSIIIVLVLGAPARTGLVVAVGLSQIGEFSFLLGQAGVSEGLINQEQYALLLTGALVSITLNPFLFRSLPLVERTLERWKWLWKLMNRKEAIQVPVPEGLKDHVVVVGYGRVGQYMVNVLSQLKVSRLVVEMDAGQLATLNEEGVPVLYGDAANSDILSHAHLERARAVVVTLPDQATAASVVATVRKISPELPLVVRAGSQEGVRQLIELGANEVIYPELEGSLDIMQEVLQYLGYGESDIQVYKAAVRHDHYDLAMNTPAEHEAIARMLERGKIVVESSKTA